MPDLSQQVRQAATSVLGSQLRDSPDLAMIVVGVAALGTETSLIGHCPLAPAIAVATLAVAAEVAAQQALTRTSTTRTAHTAP